MTLTISSLAEAMGNSLPIARYQALFPALNQALLDADCTTVNRAAMWLAQVGHESGGLRWMEELATGAAYEGRKDLGNTQPGDGVRFKGRGPIQITGRYNYSQVSKWAFEKGYVPTPTFFVDNPQMLASDSYGFLGVTWYWTVARNMNVYADAASIVGATKAVNGGTNGLADRQARWDRCRAMGDAIVPDGRNNMVFDYGVTKVMHGYNPTTGANCTGNSNGPRPRTDYVVVHTQEATSTAVNLANYCNNSWSSKNPVSYNFAVDDRETVEIVPVDQGPWAAAAANNIAVHICFAGSFASWSGSKWLETDASDGVNEREMLRRGARAAAAACRQYGIPPERIVPGNGWPASTKGIAGHVDFGVRGGGHTDPGVGFPWDEFLRMVRDFINGAETGGAPGPVVPPERRFPQDFTDRELLEYIAEQLGPGNEVWASKGMTLRDKVWGL